jgi:oligopeptide/dipeptide ABC transporter ATP-binding protein
LAVVAETAHDVAVMYASRLAEIAPAPELFEHPLHPYTQGLFRSIPRLTEQKARLDTIPGTVPNPLAFPGGCHFHPRCSLTRKRAAEAEASETFEMFAQGESLRVLKRCAEQHPPLRELRPGHGCACWEAPGYGNAADMDSANPSPSAAVSCANTQET